MAVTLFDLWTNGQGTELAALALAIGWISAWIVERTNTPLKLLAYLTAVISLGTPYILYVTAWLLLLGKAGPINQLYRTLTGTSDVLLDVYSMPPESSCG